MSELLNRIDSFIEEDFIEEDDLLEDMLDFISLIDVDQLNEEQVEALDKILVQAEEDELDEKSKRVVRGSKILRKKVCRPGYKAVGGECVKMGSQEKRKRKKGAKRGARKKKGKMAAISRKRKISMKRR